LELNELTENLVKDLSPNPELFLKARHCAEVGGVRKVSLEGKILRGEVVGNHGVYTVEVNLSSQEPAYTCNCSHGLKPCKHVLAVLWEFSCLKEKAVV